MLMRNRTNSALKRDIVVGAWTAEHFFGKQYPSSSIFHIEIEFWPNGVDSKRISVKIEIKDFSKFDYLLSKNFHIFKRIVS